MRSITRGDLLLICPPFEGIDRPSLGLHIVQALARRENLSCDVFYANLELAATVGEAEYLAVAYAPPLDLLGERLFSTYLYPTEKFAAVHEFSTTKHHRSTQERNTLPELASDLDKIEAKIQGWLERFRVRVRESDYAMYGFTTMFAQNLAVAVLCKIVREEKPRALILIGGANCEGEMASGILQLCPDADYVFSGESEISFSEFCRKFKQGKLPVTKIVVGTPNTDWQHLGMPEYNEYFQQLHEALPSSLLKSSGQIFVPYETSRGCWWGQKNHCTFCGLNANGINFRPKDAEDVIRDLKHIARMRPGVRVGMTDNIMPATYFRDLLPQLAALPQKPSIFYEQKSNLKRHQLRAIKDAGITSIQPGIEALSTSLLKRMRKGVSAAQNLAVLRDCRSLDIDPIWNLLYGFPGDSAADYAETIALIPDLVHLPPPNGCAPVSFDRFSPYFDRPEDFGISNLRPHPNYERVYSKREGDVAKFAYHFVGDAESVNASPDVVARLHAVTKAWVMAWQADVRPILCVVEAEDGYLLIDSRRPSLPEVHAIDESLALLATSTSNSVAEIPLVAQEHRWIAVIDNLAVGLASTTSERLFSAPGGARPQRTVWLTATAAGESLATKAPTGV